MVNVDVEPNVDKYIIKQWSKLGTKQLDLFLIIYINKE